MTPEQLKDWLFESHRVLILNEPEQAIRLMQKRIADVIDLINQQKNAAPVLVPDLCYEFNGDLFFASPKSR